MNKIIKSVTRAAYFFSIAVILYTLTLAVGLGGAVGNEKIYSLLFKNIITIFGFALIFGFSFLLFETKLPPSAMRIFHIAILYVSFMAASLIMANTGDDPRQIILFVFIATLLYTVVYLAALMVSKGLKKLLKK